MRIPVALLASLAATLLVAGACSGNNPTPPPLFQAGWSWNPAVAGDRPLPVVWDGATAAPRTLPLLGGDCSGSVQAMTMDKSQLYPVGISVTCTTGGESRMRPVIWTGSAAAELPVRTSGEQGTALAVSVLQTMATDGSPKTNVYVAGATGIASPLPALWMNGKLSTIDPAEFLLGLWDSGVITSISSTDRFVIVAGIVHTSTPDGPPFMAVAWVLDPDLEFVAQVQPLLPPGSMGNASVGPAVALFLVEDHVWSTSALFQGTSPGVPVYWEDADVVPLGGSDFTAIRSGVPTDLSVVGAFPDATPYVTGYTVSPGRSLLPRPGPYIWAGAVGAPLSTADAELLLGSGEAIGVYRGWAFVAGETVGRDPANPAGFLSVPALWTNGERQDLRPLVAPGTGPATVVTLPFLGWWRLPNTPGTTLPDWPYPGGFATVRGAVPITAAGSAVVRTLAADLPPP
jgi:hypothetical protein